MGMPSPKPLKCAAARAGIAGARLPRLPFHPLPHELAETIEVAQPPPKHAEDDPVVDAVVIDHGSASQLAVKEPRIQVLVTAGDLLPHPLSCVGFVNPHSITQNLVFQEWRRLPEDHHVHVPTQKVGQLGFQMYPLKPSDVSPSHEREIHVASSPLPPGCLRPEQVRSGDLLPALEEHPKSLELAARQHPHTSPVERGSTEAAGCPDPTPGPPPTLSAAAFPRRAPPPPEAAPLPGPGGCSAP